MEVMIILLPLAMLLGGLFLFAFIWSAKKGQYDDLDTPRFRLLLEDQLIKKDKFYKIKDKE